MSDVNEKERFPDYDSEELPAGISSVQRVEGRPDKFIDSYETEDGDRIQLVAYYQEHRQEWTLRKEVHIDGEDLTSMWGMSLPRNGPDDHPDYNVFMQRFEKTSLGGVTGDESFLFRLVLAVMNALLTLRLTLEGREHRIKTYYPEDWDPDD